MLTTLSLFIWIVGYQIIELAHVMLRVIISCAIISARLNPKYPDAITKEFLQMDFYKDFEAQIPIHAAVFFADCVSKKCASANVEQLFSGAGSLLADLHVGSLGAEMIEKYMFIRSNWQFAFMRPTTDEIMKAYNTAHDADEESGKSGDQSEDEDNE
ncbi:hypothetical protein CYMTET_47185 [Cymbomonas tetramitiformis]|uniref:Uncharacterized protein n=1 Tax=Cymbomonas tetramitiformis TaxID=36881 RepID=A0AAE0BUS7_9CHLO|nr:hypothetical protein CYMTET_47185 [Cymbomonas tetramitiformis]